MRRLVVITLTLLMLTLTSTSGLCGEASSDTLTIGVNTFNALTEKAVRASKLHGANIQLGKKMAKMESMYKAEIDALTVINNNLLEAVARSEACTKKTFHSMLLIAGFLFLVGTIACGTAWKVCSTLYEGDNNNERLDKG